MADIVVFGAGMAAEAAKSYLEAHTHHKVVGFSVDAEYWTAKSFCGLPIVCWDELEQEFPPGQVKLIGPISYRKMNQFRRERFTEGKARGYRYISFIHPDCRIYTEEVGEHCFILGPTTIEPRAMIGNNVVIWGGCYIAHHCVIGDHTFLSGHIAIAGGTRIGKSCYLAGKVGVSEGLIIGDECLLSWGTQVTNNLVSGSVVARNSKVKVSPVPSARMRRVL